MKFKKTLLAVFSLFMCLSAVSRVSAQPVAVPVPNNPTEPGPRDNPLDVPGKPPADQVPPDIPDNPFVDPPDGPPGPDGTLSPLIIGPCGHGQGHNPEYPCR